MAGIPERIGQYEIKSLLGRGGMGCVYHALDPGTGEEVALKVLASGLGEDESSVQRFGQELEALTRLDHRGITRALSPMLRDADHVYFALEYVQGETLAARLKRVGPLPAGQAVALAMRLFDALSAAHSVDIIHRDVKPSNVLLPEGGGGAELKVADFGLARLADVTRLTSTGQLMGTLSYMAPEQCEGKTDLDARVDVYAAGCVLFEMLAGSPPFQSDTPAAVLRAHMKARPPRLDRIRGDVPPTLVSLVNRCLAKDPKQRIQSAKEASRLLMQLPLLEDTTELIGEMPTRLVFPKAPDTVVHGVVRSERPAGAPPKFTIAQQKPPKRSKWIVPALLLLMAAAAAAAFWILRDPPGTPDAPPPQGAGSEFDAAICLADVKSALASGDFTGFAKRCAPEFLEEFLGVNNAATQFGARLGAVDASGFRVKSQQAHFDARTMRAHIEGDALPAALGLDPPTGPVTVGLLLGDDQRWRIESLLGRDQPFEPGTRMPTKRVLALVRKGHLVRNVLDLAAASLKKPAERKAWRRFVAEASRGKDALTSVAPGHPRYDVADRVWTIEMRITGLPVPLATEYNGMLVNLRAETLMGRGGRSVERLRPVSATLTWLDR